MVRWMVVLAIVIAGLTGCRDTDPTQTPYPLETPLQSPGRVLEREPPRGGALPPPATPEGEGPAFEAPTDPDAPPPM
jgi:hypothetical protein